MSPSNLGFRFDLGKTPPKRAFCARFGGEPCLSALPSGCLSRDTCLLRLSPARLTRLD
jgi:hypothetical protein